MKKLFYITILCILTLPFFAQEYYIKGKITDSKTSEGIKHVKLSLYNSKDSLMKQVYSDRKGRYSLKAKVNENDYLLVNEKDYFEKRFVKIPVGRSAEGDITLDKMNSLPKSSLLSRYRIHREFKKINLKAEDLKAVQKDGNTSWTVKATLTNRSRDTLYYFATPYCKSMDFSVDTTALFVNDDKCASSEQAVIAVKPKGQYIVDLEIGSKEPLASSMEFRVVMFYKRAKNRNNSVTLDRYERMFLLLSNRIKT